MPTTYLVEGPVGAGKSTYAIDLAGQIGGVHIALDEWFSRLYSPDRPGSEVMAWYGERKARLIELIWTHSKCILGSGINVILELGLIQRAARHAFCSKVANEGENLIVRIIDAPMEVRRERVRKRNIHKGRTFSMVVPDHIFEMASKLWEPPDDEECSIFSVEFVDTASVRSVADFGGKGRKRGQTQGEQEYE